MQVELKINSEEMKVQRFRTKVRNTSLSTEICLWHARPFISGVQQNCVAVDFLSNHH